LGRELRRLLLKPSESVTPEIRQPHIVAKERDEAAVITVETTPAGGVMKAFQLDVESQTMACGPSRISVAYKSAM